MTTVASFWVGSDDEEVQGAPNQKGTSEVVCNEPRWQQAHDQLLRLARSRAGLDLDEGRWLVAALRGGTHVRLGYGSFVEYIERLFGYGPRLTYEKLRVAEALERLPATAEALGEGGTSWSAVRELTRVTTPETEHEWLAATKGKTVREIEKLVSGRSPGSLPEDPGDAQLRRHVIRLEVSGEALATFREAMSKIRRDAGESLDDDAAILLMARQVLQGPADTGRANYQVALTVCEGCHRGFQQGRGELVEVGAEVMAMAGCDVQHVGKTHVGKVAPRATQEVPPATRRAVLRRDGGRCVFPGCRHATFVDVHHVELRAEGGQHDPDNLITVCSAHHRAVHQGHVSVEGSATALRIRHADGSDYGMVASPAAVDVWGKAFRALRGLGFGEGEVRRALERVATHLGAGADVELLVRRCLLALTNRVVAQAS